MVKLFISRRLIVVKYKSVQITKCLFVNRNSEAMQHCVFKWSAHTVTLIRFCDFVSNQKKKDLIQAEKK